MMGTYEDEVKWGREVKNLPKPILPLGQTWALHLHPQQMRARKSPRLQVIVLDKPDIHPLLGFDKEH